MKLYRCDSIEQGIRSMAQSNESSIIFEYAWCANRIRPRYNMIADIPLKILMAWDANRTTVVKNWRQSKGLLLYRHMGRMDECPKGDALLFIEMPLMLNDFKEFSAKASKEVIVYMPPDWSLHQATLDAKYPLSDTFKRAFGVISSLIGKTDNLTRNQELLIKHAALDRNNVAVFSLETINSMANLPRGQWSVISRKFNLKKYYAWYAPYRLMFEPGDSDLLEMYKVLEAEPDCGNGMRLLKWGWPTQGYTPFFEKAMRVLIKQNNVAEYDAVHVVKKGFKKMDYEVMDAIAGVHRGNHMKLRSMVEDAPIYPIGGIRG